ncbi:MAG TPA: FUSC family protein [Bradyrhizobium sp.]|nr:FUSC family protein [Bradyrhizobium sp.]
MVTHADSLRRELRASLSLLRPFPGRLEFAARLALICALTTLVVEIYQTPDPALTAYVAFFVMKPDRTTSVILSIVMVLLISIIIGLVILVSMAVIDQPAWRVASMAMISFGLLFLASASKLKPVGPIIALIAAYALDLLSKAQIGELATRGLLYAWLFVTIPASVSVIVNLFLGPPPRRLIERALAHRLALAAAMLRGPDHHKREAFAEALSEGTGELLTWLKLAGAEKTSPAEDIAALRQAAESIVPILLLVDMIDRNPEGMLPDSLKGHIADVLDEMASILSAARYPVEISLRDDGAPLSPSAAEILADMKEALARFTAAPLPDLPPPSPEKAKGGFFLPDAFTNPEHVHYALKTTAAAMFCYATYTLLDWPGIHTSLITCYIVSLGTTGETVEKLTLRILGCLLGAAAGIAAIVFLMPNFTSIGALMAVVFVATLASGWVAGGSPRIAYAGFQIAFAFFLCTIQGSAPAFDMTIARDRVIGILFGNLVVYLVFSNIWPVTVAQRVDSGIATLLRRLGAMATAVNRSRRCSLASEASAALGAIEQDIELAQYEPSSVRPANDWLDLRRRTANAIAALMGPLWLRANQDPSLGGELSRRLNGLAGSFGDHSESGAPPTDQEGASGAPGPPNLPVPDANLTEESIVAHLQGLERALALRSAEEG